MKYQYTQEERKTIIRFDEADQIVQIYTYNRKLQNRMDTLQEQRPEEINLIRYDGQSVTYTFPKAWVKINPPGN